MSSEQVVQKQERWLLIQSMHLGWIKESFRAGTEIVHDKENNRLIIDGREFDTTKDLTILKRNDWVVPWSDEAAAEIDGESLVHDTAEERRRTNLEKLQNRDGMKIVMSDEDEMGETIDISYTKERKNRMPKTGNTGTRALPIIRGDESPAERQSRLKTSAGKRKPESVVEMQRRVMKMRTTPAKMDVVTDDGSLAGVSGYDSMNAGQVTVRPPQEHAELRKQSEKVVKRAVKKGQSKATAQVSDGSPRKIKKVKKRRKAVKQTKAPVAAKIKRVPVRQVQKGPKVAGKVSPKRATRPTDTGGDG